MTEAIGVLPGTHAGVQAVGAHDEIVAAFGEQFVEHSRTYPAAQWWRRLVAAGAVEATTQQLMRGRLTAYEAAAAVDAAIRRAIS
jgi:hypothetical protein